MTGLQAVRVPPTALDELAAMLAGAGLPVADLMERGRIFFRFEHHGLAGYGGIEGEGPDRLLRSLIVAPTRRGTGLGSAILGALEQQAATLHVERLHLLTTTAAAFFRYHGYIDTTRGGAPAAIAASTEFSTLCPASATYLVKTLDTH